VLTLFSMLSCLLLGILIVLSYPKNRLVYFVILGITTLVGGAYISVYLNSHINMATFIKYESRMLPYAMSLLAEGLFLSLGLGYKQSLLRKEKESVLRKNLDLELGSLRSQMNPHFIFNCINNIDAFVHSNDKYNATLYLNKFAKLLRNILDSSKQNTVAFTKDIDTLNLYIELEELRHESKFKTIINIEEELLSNDYKVPPLIIQPFVENAILHGLKNRVDNEGLLQIEIKKSTDKIEYTIKDNGIGRKAAGMIAQNKEASYGMQMSYDRIKLFNKEEKASVQIIDLYKEDIATGTEVKIFLNII
jgi:LytS/YehU family sensor histidine kinase